MLGKHSYSSRLLSLAYQSPFMPPSPRLLSHHPQVLHHGRQPLSEDRGRRVHEGVAARGEPLQSLEPGQLVWEGGEGVVGNLDRRECFRARSQGGGERGEVVVVDGERLQ